MDVIASLRLWVQLNSDNYSSHMLEAAPSSASSSSTSSSTGSTEESSAIILSQEAIRNVLEALTKIPVLDIGDWTTVLRSLTWLSSPRWLLTDPCPDPAPRSDQPEELADQMCAGTVIRSPHLTRILYNFISGQGLLPFSLGDKQLVSWIYCSIYKPQQIIIQIIIFYYVDNKQIIIQIIIFYYVDIKPIIIIITIIIKYIIIIIITIIIKYIIIIIITIINKIIIKIII